jgi:hypothetical protein
MSDPTTAPATTAVDPFDSAVSATLQSSAAQIRDNVSQALPVNADVEAQTRRFAAAAGVPLVTARAQPDMIQRQAQMTTFDPSVLQRQFPTTAQLLQNPDLARITHDDIPATTSVEQAAQALGGQFAIGLPDTPPSYMARVKSWIYGMLGKTVAEPQPDGAQQARDTLAIVAKRAGQTPAEYQASTVGTADPALAGSEDVKQLVSGAVDSASAGLAPSVAPAPYSTGGRIAGGAGTLAGFLVGAPLKIARYGVGKIAGSVFEHTVGESFVKAAAKDVTQQAATLGIASGITATGRALDQSTPGAAAATVGQATAAGAATGAIFGGASRLLPDNTLSQAAMRFLGISAAQDAVSGQSPFDDRPLEQKIFDYGMNAVFSAHGAGRVDPDAGWVRDATRAADASSGAQQLGDLASASAASKLRDRDPAVFKKFVRDAAQDGPVPAVYVDARQFAESLHQSGVGMDDLNDKMPDVASQLNEALAIGGQVRIPVEDFATHIAGGKLEAPLMPHLRTDPAGMTLAESEAFYQSHVQGMQSAADGGASEPAPVDPTIDSRRQVIDNVKAQLAATSRFPEGVSDAYAALHGTFYATQAERAGMLPHELLAKYPLHIAADNLAADSLSADSKRGAYSPDTKTIAILKGADLSTFLHESGHHFLDTLSHIAAQPDAPASIKSDMATLLRSYGVDGLDTWHGMTLDEQRAHHENFAKGFEQYLMDGKAPDLELRGLFGRFRAWLTHVYRSLSNRLVDLSPEVRGVFDRMLASEHAIKEAETARAYMPLFHSPEQASMSPEEWSKYQALGKNATDTAIEALSSKTIRDMAWADRTRNAALKALTKDADAKRRGIAQEVRSEVMAEPVYRAWAFLTGRDQTGQIKDEATQADIDHSAAVRLWTEQRAIVEEATRARMRTEAWEASDASDASDASKLPAKNPGLAKGQWLAKNRKRIEIEVQRAMLDHDEQTPRPKAPAKTPEAHSTDSTLGAGKLNTGMLTDLAGKDTAKALAERHMTGAKGLDPGIVADMFGFSDAQQMVRALTLADHPRDVLEALVDQRMLERHGEISSPDALTRSADAAVQNDVRTRFIATELRSLKKAIGPARDLARAAKEVAESTIDAKRVRDITEGQYTLAETRAAKEAEKRLAAGDTTGAAVAKRDQLLNNQLERAARDAIEYVSKAVDYLAKFDKASTRESIDLEYREQIDALLDRADIRRSVTGAALDKREALSMFVEKMVAAGYEPQIPEHLLDEAKRWHYKDMPLLAFKGLVDAVKSIEHLGKLKQTLRDGQEAKAIGELADEVRATTAKLPQRAPESNRGLNRMQSAWLNAKTAGRSLQASLLKMEQMFDWLDARDPNGVLNRVVFRRISDAGVRENDMLAKVKGQIDELVKSHLPDVTKDGGKIYEARELIDSLTGHYARFTKKQVLMLAGNMGNESNAAKVSLGENWEQRDVWNFLNANMNKADWDFVAGMGKTLETLWPEKLAMSRRLGNTNPEKIAPRAFDTPHGRYDGWYWPMIYDPARAQDVAERGARAGDALFENVYSKANSDTGRMNTRNENYARPILLDLDALPRVIKDEIHDIAFREAVIDADRFLHHPVVRDSIVSALSQQHYDQLRPWLQSIANDGKSSTESMRALKFFADVAAGARTRATIIGLGYRISTILVHGMSAGAESIAELGPVWFASGLKDFANPAQWGANKDFVFERSGEMRNRMNEVDRDVRDHLRQIDTRMMDPMSGNVARGADNFKAHAYTAIAAIDMMTALPTWMGAYKRAMTPEARGGMGLSEQDAVYFADKTVRNAHGGTGVKDLAGVQRGPELLKLFTMFYTFWNHNVNRIMDTARLAKDPATWRDSQLAATVIVRTLVYTIGVQVLHSLLHPPKDGADEESWAAWAGKEFLASAFAGIPIARDLSAHFLSGKDYSATPAASLVKIIGDSGTDALNAATGKEANDRWLKHTITTAGAVFALPLGQPAATAQFLWDVGDGKTHPESAKDWWNGIVHGDIHAH